MKLFCNGEESEQVCKIMNEFDVHRSTYIKVNHGKNIRYYYDRI